MKKFVQWLEEAANSITVYHGSRQDGLSDLKGAEPPYEGGLGYGVYVGTQIETGQFYGPHVYELKTKFGWDKVLCIGGEDNYEALADCESILVGESVPPFSFYVGDKKYAVVNGSGSGGDWVSDSRKLEKLLELLGLESSYRHGLQETGNSPKWIQGIWFTLERAVKHQEMPSVDDFEDELYRWAGERVKYPGELGRVLPGEIGQVATTQHQLRMQNYNQRCDTLVNGIKSQLARYIAQAEALSDMGEEISLDDIGTVAEQAGYAAVYVEGIRCHTTVNEEMLVFDEDNLVMVRQIS